MDNNTEEFVSSVKDDKIYRILSLDGGGAKGFYSLGVLREIEGLINRPLCEHFDLVFGTSTGAIIAALIALGFRVTDIYDLYKIYVPLIMKARTPKHKSAALSELTSQIFGDQKFDNLKTGVGIVAVKWVIEKPMIFKGDIQQGHGRLGTFVPGFGCTISDAVQASCSAFPFFLRKTITTAAGDNVELIDGGYCANNPTLYAIADAIIALKIPRENLRVVNVGVGVYPEPKPSLKMWFAKKYLLSVQLLQKTMEINTQSMDQLRAILYKDIKTMRISDTFEKPDMATDFMEYNIDKLNILHQRGRESFASRETQLQELLFK